MASGIRYTYKLLRIFMAQDVFRGPRGRRAWRGKGTAGHPKTDADRKADHGAAVLETAGTIIKPIYLWTTPNTTTSSK